MQTKRNYLQSVSGREDSSFKLSKKGISFVNPLCTMQSVATVAGDDDNFHRTILTLNCKRRNLFIVPFLSLSLSLVFPLRPAHTHDSA